MMTNDSQQLLDWSCSDGALRHTTSFRRRGLWLLGALGSNVSDFLATMASNRLCLVAGLGARIGLVEAKSEFNAFFQIAGAVFVDLGHGFQGVDRVRSKNEVQVER